MENLDVQKFDDPALKTALRRHFSCSECCPLQLKRRIAEAMSCSSKSGGGPTALMRWWRSTGPSLAIAAVMLIAIGTVGLILSRSPRQLPARLQTAAISRHDHCCQLAEHVAQDIPKDFKGMGQYLRAELKHPVLAANFTKDSWHFRGAAICPVDGVKSAHLLYDQGTRTLSVFSLPADSFPALQDQKIYEGSADGHTLVARREGSAVYCLVVRDTSGSTNVSALRQMLKDHESEASVAYAPMPAGKYVQFATAIAREP